MNNEMETIDGVKGEWRTVTKPSEVIVGQRVRYGGCKIGCDGEKRTVQKIEKGVVRTWNGFKGGCYCENLFKGIFSGTIQAFFPLPDRAEKRKVAKVRIYCNDIPQYWFEVTIGKIDCHYKHSYTSRKSAIRGAQRFCRAIGYECEIQEELK